jgi:hypothetical protein
MLPESTWNMELECNYLFRAMIKLNNYERRNFNFKNSEKTSNRETI